MKHAWWIVVCDAARARVFGAPELGARMIEISDLIEPAGRMSGRELGSDRPGRGMDRASGGRHAMEPPLDPHTKAEQEFAHAIAETLDQAQRSGRFEQWALIAPASLLGHLRPRLRPACRAQCAFEWVRDLTGFSSQQIADHVRDELASRFERPRPG
jgi:protein required for attachment to host cells